MGVIMNHEVVLGAWDWARWVLVFYGVLAVGVGFKNNPKTATWMGAIVLIAAAIGALVARVARVG